MLASCNKDEHQHSYTGSVTTPATCSNPGVETFTCSCGAAYTQIIPATNDHAWEKIKVYANSCESEGWTVYECSVCHEQKQDDWTPKLDHQYVLVEDESSEATCTEAGYRTYQCSYCKSRYTDNQYTAQHPALGHDWIENTDAKETIPAAVLEQLGYQAGQSDQAKKDGWGVSAAATCTTDAVYQRVCARCGKEDPKTISNSKLGHFVSGMAGTDGKVGTEDDITLAEALFNNQAGICKVNTSLVDAEDNAIYAFECDRENCPVEVKINAAGDTRHYIAAEEHTYTGKGPATQGQTWDGKYTETKSATCDEDGSEHRFCVNCNYEDKRTIEETGHKYNTVQMDGKTPTLVCSADPILSGDVSGKDPLEEAAKVLKADCETTAEYTQRYAKLAAAYNEFTSKHEGADIAYFCVRCYEFVEAKEHSWIYSALEDGKYGLNDYEKDENGKPVKADITADKFTCQYVEVCENCGTAKQKGAHGKITEATCRSGGYCTLCGEQREKQKFHGYIDITALLNEDETTGNADTVETSFIVNNKKVTYGELRTAYEKVSATETWMVPVAGSCNEAGKSVGVCVYCLLDAANGDEFDWSPKTVDKQSDYDNAIEETKNQSVSAVTYEFDAGHKYEMAYFTTNAKSATDGYVNASQTAGRLLWENTNCTFGFKIAYICKDCGAVYTNVPVADDPDTEVVESKDNDADDYGYTDANGFLLKESVESSVGTDKEFDAEALADVLKEENVEKNTHDKHTVYVTDDYQTTNGWKASTCIANAIIPYKCQNCGQTITAEYDENDDSFDKATVSAGQLTLMNGTVVKTTNTIEGDDKALEPDNHAGKKFACGDHCDAYVTEGTGVDAKKLYCSAFDDNTDGNDTANVVEVKAEQLTEAYHNTVNITYELRNEKDLYLDDYTLSLAEVDEDAIVKDADAETYSIDWTKATLVESDKASSCAGNSNLKLPMIYKASQVSQTEGMYLVLVGKDGTRYALTSFAIYPDSTSNTPAGTAGAEIDVAKTDKFFIDFGGNRPAGLPVVAVNQESLGLAFTNGKVEPVGTGSNAKKVFSVEVGADISLDSNTSLKDLFDIAKTTHGSMKDVYFEIDLGGHEITDSTTDRFVFGADDAKSVKFSNGTLDFTATADALGTKYDTDGAAVSLLKPTGTTELILDKMTVKTNGSAVFAAYQGAGKGAPAPTVTISGSTITAKGAYGVATNASGITAESGKGTINITDSKITSEDAALFVNIPSTVTVKGSELTSKSQVVVVRGGNVNLENTKLTLAAGYVDEVVTAENFGKVVGGKLAITNSSFDATDALKGYASGLTLQDYRLAGLWIDNGTAIARGAIVIGNSSEDSYQYATHLSMSGVTVDNKTTGETAVPDFVVASRYAETTMMDGDKVKVMVSVTCNDNADLLAGAVITTNSIDGSITFNGAVVNK